MLPDDARDATEALRLADERMYARKRSRRAGSRGQARDLLVQVMAEREPGSTSTPAASPSSRPPSAAGSASTPRSSTSLVRAAELHDVGMVAVPDDILAQARPARRAEWAIMRQHTIAGERILAAAAEHAPGRPARPRRPRALRRHAATRTASRGDEIPLGARIICACDAYDAMLSRRPVQGADDAALEAIAELRGCCGRVSSTRAWSTVLAIDSATLVV